MRNIFFTYLIAQHVNNKNYISEKILEIYPNPVGDHFFIKVNNKNVYNEIVLIMPDGKIIKRVVLNNEDKLLKFKSSDLPKGLMIVEAIGKESHIFSKLIIQ